MNKIEVYLEHINLTIVDDSIARISNLTNINFIVNCVVKYDRYSSDPWFDTFKANLSFPLEALSCINSSTLKMVVNFDSFYSIRSGHGFSNLDAYICSKKTLGDWLKLISQKNDFTIANLYLEHVYGLNDDPDKFVPKVISSAKNNDNINLINPNEKRDFIYVDDVSSAVCKLITNRNPRGYFEYSIGTGVHTSIEDLVKLIYKKLGSTGKVISKEFNEDNIMSFTHKYIDGWTPVFDLESGVKKLIDSI